MIKCLQFRIQNFPLLTQPHGYLHTAPPLLFWFHLPMVLHLCLPLLLRFSFPLTLLYIQPPTYSLFQTLSHQGSTPLRGGGWMLGDTPLCSDAPKPFPAPSESIPILTFSLHYKCPWMDYSQPLQKPAGSNLELDPSKPFLLIIHLSIYFMFSSCFIFKLSATYIVWLYLSRDLSFSFRIPC